ncbi:hypothetical protein [Candidatus Poriferisodalis sp.]|uniref:hypothetical protein n=1 Tax=Candidatus Poriferisodalis sp. TaxID=3101277 RepID=UPI003B5B05A4
MAELDALLADEGVAEVLHLHVAVGAVIAPKTDARLTSDVDVVSEAMTEQLRRAVAVVSERHPGLRRDWLNDGAKPQRVNLPMEPERIYTGSCLVVDSAGDRYVLAMKLASGRPIDEADCELLIRSLAIRDERAARVTLRHDTHVGIIIDDARRGGSCSVVTVYGCCTVRDSTPKVVSMRARRSV